MKPNIGSLKKIKTTYKPLARLSKKEKESNQQNQK